MYWRMTAMGVSLATALACLWSGVCQAKMKLPDPLLRRDGSKVTNTRKWEKVRRPETLQLFKDHVYGRQTVGRPKDMSFVVVQEDRKAMGGRATLKVVEIRIKNNKKSDTLTIRLVIFTPNSVRKAAPGFLLINHRSKRIMDATRKHKSGYWPAEEIVGRGYAACVFHVSDVDPDRNDFKNGVHKFFDGSGRVDDRSWGALAAWAWGASRCMDYFERDKEIDHTQMAIVGHSRTGKAALVTGAYDQRFYLPISNNSGESGAALARHRRGESLASITGGFPYWFCSKYRTYAKRVDDLPVDQHQLIALMAPRPVYVASASEDSWADPKGEFLSLVNARPVYQLYGFTGIGYETFPAKPNTQIRGDRMGYHLRQGRHSLRKWDWGRYMDFFDHLQAGKTKPQSPSSLQVEADSDSTWLTTGSVQLRWKDRSDNETGFCVERKEAGSAPVEVCASLTADMQAFTDSTPEPGKVYYYRVCSYNPSGKSAWSNVQKVVVPSQRHRHPENPEGLGQGVNYAYYEFSKLKALPNFAGHTPASQGTAKNITLRIPNRRENSFAVEYTGCIDVPKDGVYNFYLKSDDGSKLFIGDKLVIDNGGSHGPVERATAVALKAGKHTYTIHYFDDYGGQSIRLYWKGPGIGKQPVPEDRLFCEKRKNAH